jgi:predicted glycoside hydrolase/deacetylase ChbG (UPF0249 family)
VVSAVASAVCTGLLVVNADDWGRAAETTDRILDCVAGGSVSAVSAMVFMEDSERAAVIARDRSLDTGLHLNFTTPFSARACPQHLRERQRAVASHLLRHRLGQAVFHPRLAPAFADLVAAQCDEFHRLYGAAPARLDGHHHMHLCANVLLGRLLPPGTAVRRSFSFERGEKSPVNRLYRHLVDRVLARRHHLADYFFSLAPLDPPERLARICARARRFVVEMEAHPAVPDEYRFLTDGDIVRWAAGVSMGPLPQPLAQDRRAEP